MLRAGPALWLTARAAGHVLGQADPGICDVLSCPWVEFILSPLHTVCPRQGKCCDPPGDARRFLTLPTCAAVPQLPASQFSSL